MNILKKIIPVNLKRIIKEDLGVHSFQWSINNLKRKNFNPRSIVDIGAYKGEWTLEVLRAFPDIRAMMIEAQKNKEIFLKNITKEFPTVDYEIALLSSVDNVEKLFLENETARHITKSVPLEHPHDVMHSITLDTLLKKKNFPHPDFLKLDVQGHEMEVLKGAENSLTHVELCMLEISLLNIGDGQPLLKEMVLFMDDKGFQVYDICQLMRRPFEKALFQMDVLFIQKNSGIIAETRWD